MAGGKVRVSVVLFAGYREAVGSSSVGIELDEGATVGDIAHAMCGLFPDLPRDHSRIVVAVNEEYQHHDFQLRDGDEVALIPPVSGGGTGGAL